MFLMVTKPPSYLFSCLTSYICVFCRNEENKTKNKQFGQEIKNMCKEELVVETITLTVVTIRKSQEVTAQLTLGVVATIKSRS